MKKIRVIIADDQALICDAIRIILDSQSDIEVIATADNGRAAVKLASEHQPDLALLDIKLPDMSGIEALKEIKTQYPKILVLMLTTFDPDEYILGAFRNGAAGCLLKDLSGEQLAVAVRNACAGNFTIPAAIAARIIGQIPRETRKRSLADYKLTQREAEVAELVGKGYLNIQIARTMGISLGTAKNYISALYSKLEVGNRQEAAYIIAGIKNKGDY